MNFSIGGLYHIYNQGNNRQPIFFSKENYEFFLRKVRVHILPYADMLAWCLMPNHFHLMVEVKEVVLPMPSLTHGVTALPKPGSHPVSNPSPPQQPGSHPVSNPSPPQQPGSHPVSNPSPPQQPGSHPVSSPRPITINTSIGIMLRSYTRAINIQEHRSGALFREETKAICLNNFPSRSSLWHHSQGITYIHISIPEWQYPQVCFNYIHNNPVKAGLVADARDWEFSSLSEIINNRTDALVNMERIHGLGLNYG